MLRDVIALGMAAAMSYSCLVEALFTPHDDVETAIVRELRKAESSIDCSLFGISNAVLSVELAKKAQAGVPVRLGLDRRQAAGAYDTHKVLQAAGAQVRIKKSLTLEHNKFCIIDGKTVLMGSWNWSQSASAQDNSEVILSGDCSQIEYFKRAFARIWKRDADKNKAGE